VEAPSVVRVSVSRTTRGAEGPSRAGLSAAASEPASVLANVVRYGERLASCVARSLGSDLPDPRPVRLAINGAILPCAE
jgi:hypothetical protein